jgi:hypothetical protein
MRSTAPHATIEILRGALRLISLGAQAPGFRLQSSVVSLQNGRRNKSRFPPRWEGFRLPPQN